MGAQERESERDKEAHHSNRATRNSSRPSCHRVPPPPPRLPLPPRPAPSPLAFSQAAAYIPISRSTDLGCKGHTRRIIGTTILLFLSPPTPSAPPRRDRRRWRQYSRTASCTPIRAAKAGSPCKLPYSLPPPSARAMAGVDALPIATCTDIGYMRTDLGHIAQALSLSLSLSLTHTHTKYHIH
jgi:hypothetical protein